MEHAARADGDGGETLAVDRKSGGATFVTVDRLELEDLVPELSRDATAAHRRITETTDKEGSDVSPSRRCAAPRHDVRRCALCPRRRADGDGAAGRNGVSRPSGGTRFVAIGTNAQQETTLELVDASNGTIQRFVDFAGTWGIPTVTEYSAQPGGLSQDGKTIVLGDAAAVYPRTVSGFLVVNQATLAVRHSIRRGDFAYDALSPDAKGSI